MENIQPHQSEILPGKQAFSVENHKLDLLLLEGLWLDAELTGLVPHGVQAGAHCLSLPFPRTVWEKKDLDKRVREIRLFFCKIQNYKYKITDLDRN